MGASSESSNAARVITDTIFAGWLAVFTISSFVGHFLAVRCIRQ